MIYRRGQSGQSPFSAPSQRNSHPFAFPQVLPSSVCRGHLLHQGGIVGTSDLPLGLAFTSNSDATTSRKANEMRRRLFGTATLPIPEHVAGSRAAAEYTFGPTHARQGTDRCRRRHACRPYCLYFFCWFCSVAEGGDILVGGDSSPAIVPALHKSAEAGGFVTADGLIAPCILGEPYP